MTEEEPSEQIDYMQGVAYFTLNQERRDNCELSIVCCSPSKIKEYNVLYRGENYVPDVLTFVINEVGVEEGAYPACVAPVLEHETCDIGDVFICVKQIERQAKKLQLDFDEELARVVIHGVLHLLGYTHKGYDHTEPMLVRQEEILGEIMKRYKV